MTKKELLRLYKQVAKEIGFKEDPTHKGWMPKLGPNDFKCKIVHGFTKKGAVTLTVGPKGVINLKALELAGSYALVEKKLKPCIVLPKVWNVGNYGDRSWIVRERVDGVNPLKDFPLSSRWERENIANLYWNILPVFSAVESEKQPVGDFEDFFRNRLDKWIELGKSGKSKQNSQKHEIFRTIADNMFRYVFYESDLWESADLEMELFFRNFGNTDIVFQNGVYYLPSSEIVLLPEFYGAAYFVWNMLMYSYDIEDWLVSEDIAKWLAAFSLACPSEVQSRFNMGFHLILFERVIATLLVDIPRLLSPFDVKGNEGAVRAQKAEKVFVGVLKGLLEVIPTLTGNPFKEDFKALDKIYK